MNILFLGGLFPLKIKQEIESNSKGGIQYAANSLQWNFVLGLDTNADVPIKIITAPLIGSFPLLYKKLFIRRIEFNHIKNSNDISIGYCNIAILKNYFIRKALLKELEQWAKRNTDEVKIVVVYGMLAPWVLSAITIKKKYPSIKICLIVPDLPEFMNNSKNIIFKTREYFHKNLYRYITKFDSFVFLTSKMADHFNVHNKPWITIEGMVNPIEINNLSDYEESEKKTVMYSGTLDERFGILDLVTSFEAINDQNYELWICGSGNTQDFIKSRAIIDNRIKFWGLLSREQVLKLQRKATVLVNPRNSNGEYTKYSFPSKIMEYLLSGTPCIMKPLPGIPNEYNKYVYLVNDNKAASLKNKIQEVCSLDQSELNTFGSTAKKFVLENKNCTVQTKKMIEMFKALS